MNVTDLSFYSLIDEIAHLEVDELYRRIRENFAAVNPVTARNMAVFFNKFGYWGKLEPEKGIYEEIELKATALRSHLSDYLWVYERLCDYRSKKTFYAVLSNWYRYDFTCTAKAKEYLFDDYFDLDLVKCSRDEVVVDLGAYTGDTTLSYIRNYGEECYKRIYCYEITPSVFAVLKNTLARYRDIEYRLKGVSDECGAMKLQLSCGGNSANVLSLVGEETVETTTLDADISEPVSLIKADIEGYELKALRGAARHIVNDHPKLLISVYHSNDDIWEIPKTIHAFSSDYRFYLRFKGSCIYPTEITLFAL